MAGFRRVVAEKREFILPFAAFLVAFLLRHYFLTAFRYPMMIHEQDAVGYMDAAKSILQLRLPEITGRPPGYPLVIAIFAIFTAGLEDAARLASIFMDALVVLPLYYLARIFLPPAASFAACLVWGSFTFSLIFAPSPLSQSSALCYLLSAVALLHHGLEKERAGELAGAGALFALAFLARPEGIVGFGCGFLLSLTPLFGRERFSRKNVLLPAGFLFGFLILAGPYLAALRAALGHWALSPMAAAHVKTADLLLTLNAQGELQKSGAGLAVWKEYYGSLPGFLAAAWGNVKAFAGVYGKTFPLWMHLVTGAGAVVLAWKGKTRDLAVLLIPAAVIVPNFVVTIPKTHSYLYPLFAISFVFFAAALNAGIVTVRRGIGKLFPGGEVRYLEAALTAIPLLAVSYVAYASCQDADANYRSPGLVNEAMMTEKIYKGAGEIIRANSQKDDVIMTRWGLVGYFADRPVLTLPKGGVKEVVDYGRKNGARFLLVDSNSVLSRRQELRELLGPLEGKEVNPAYGMEVFTGNYFPDLGGYVVYRYRK